METKICKKCKRELPKTREYFYVNNERKDGFNSTCKECLSRKNDKLFNIQTWYNEKSERFKMKWQFEDILWIYNNYLQLEKKEVLKHFNNQIKYKTITNLVYQWDLRKINKNDDWSKDDIEFLKSNYPFMLQKELEDRFPNRTWDAIKNKASKLNIHRDKDAKSIINSKAHIGIKLSRESRKKMSLSRRGKNNPFWKGGISPIIPILRDYTIPWKIDSLKEYDYKCALSGVNDGTLQIHHLNKNFSEIAYETFEILNLPLNNDMSKYSQSEISLVRDKILELHYFYGLGVPLTKEIHKKFHHIYGTKNNTPEQFEEFKQEYINSLIGGENTARDENLCEV